jgi:predicted molibdopterin-dependent oxidoreductase YjgC
MTNLQILAGLTKSMSENGSNQTPPSHTDSLFEEIRRMNILYKNVDPAAENKAKHYWTTECKKEDNCASLFCNSFATEDGKARFAAYRVETGTYHTPEFSFNAIEHRYKEWIRKLFIKSGKIPAAVD